MIDPGPQNARHLNAIRNALDETEEISAILLTHSHLDHSALVPDLKQSTGAKSVAFGPTGAGQREDVSALRNLGGGEGLDTSFVPDQTLNDGDSFSVGELTFQAIWTPGHMGNHLCFRLGEDLFCGDHVMDWSTSIVSPPDGDLTDFMTSLEKLKTLPVSRYLPGHGNSIPDPRARVEELWTHRKMRETQILEALDGQPGCASNLAQRIYTDISPALLPAAARNVLAHLIDLNRQSLVKSDENIQQDSTFQLT